MHVRACFVLPVFVCAFLFLRVCVCARVRVCMCHVCVCVCELSLIHIAEPTRPYYNSYAVFCLKNKNNFFLYFSFCVDTDHVES